MIAKFSKSKNKSSHHSVFFFRVLLIIFSVSQMVSAGLVNFAIGKCYKAGFEPYDNPSRAFDGNLNTETGSSKTWILDGGGLAVDFGKVEKISKVVLIAPIDNDSFPTYDTQTSNNGSSWTTIKSVPAPKRIDTQEGLNIETQYLRIYEHRFGYDPWWFRSLSEVEFYGQNTTSTNGIIQPNKSSQKNYSNRKCKYFVIQKKTQDKLDIELITPKGKILK